MLDLVTPFQKSMNVMHYSNVLDMCDDDGRHSSAESYQN